MITIYLQSKRKNLFAAENDKQMCTEEVGLSKYHTFTALKSRLRNYKSFAIQTKRAFISSFIHFAVKKPVVMMHGSDIRQNREISSIIMVFLSSASYPV